MFKRLGAAAVCLTLLAPLAFGADQTGPRKIAFQDVRLKNGLRVILSEDHSAPVYAINLTYNVGSRNEVKDRTGFAHLFEHMMFQGSGNLGKGEHMLLVEENGGTMNGSTNADRTNYFESLPANQLDLGLFLESDRMRSLAVTQANLDNQRNAVQEERRLRVDNQPYGKTMEVVLDTAYDNFAYKHSTIGSMDDLNAATIQDVQQFFKTYYAPNNVVLTLVGDFDSKTALAKIRKYFEDIPSQPQPPEPDMTEPKQTAERRVTVEDAFAPFPRLQIVFKGPRGNTPDHYALSVLTDVLAGGQSSRLYQKLVKQQQLAVQVMAFAQSSRGPGLVTFAVMPRPGKNLADIEKSIYEEVDRLKTDPPAAWELAKAAATIKTRRATQLQTSLSRANLIGESAVFFNDPDLVNTVPQKYAAVTASDVQRVAAQYLVETNRTVVTTVPKPKAAANAGQ
jgi:zinc protease